MMITQGFDPLHFKSRVRQIKAHMQIALTQWGLLPKFNRWRLAQDPVTNMVVLFGILDHKYIATHSAAPFSNYFDLRLMHDLEKDLDMPIITSEIDGLRYAFVLDMGEPKNSSTFAEPAEPGSEIAPRGHLSQSLDSTLLYQRLDRFMKINNSPGKTSLASQTTGLKAAQAAQINQQMVDSETTLDDRDVRESGLLGPPAVQ